MRTQQILLITGAAVASAVAQAAGPVPTLFERASNSIDERDTAECSSVALSLLPSLIDVPTPDSSLVDFLASQTQVATATDPCQMPAITGSMADEYSSYFSDLFSWYDEHTAEFSSVLAACSDVPAIKSQLDILPESVTSCSKITWASATGNSASSETTSGNAAPRQTGMAVAAAAMAGLVVVGMQ
ncbi:hypothetical protein G7Z17_g3887 [Cylindrodendrum hubeiense]|uniref:Infection structure specific protein n=1 Tax=Cylindrodendrum hubeiense TaxID=595255 RepID=A0A9P5HDQ6_9HYPO|nr:hypothetical protein G7Z17_g3887 [Cylindrodendrum hubeiense]